MKKIISVFLSLILIMSFLTAGAENGIISSDLSLATDEELEAARLEIVAEQRSRIKTKIVLDPSEATLAVGARLNMKPSVSDLAEGVKAGGFVWTTSDPGIVTVQNGNLRAVGAGSATITCSATLSDETEISTDCTVTVIVPVTSIAFKEKTASAKVGDTYSQEAVLTPADATNKELTYSSSNESIATVDEKGAVSVIAAGKVTITAATTDGSNKTASYSLSVPTFDAPDSFTYARGAENKITVQYLGVEDVGNLSVKSNNKAIADVEYSVTSPDTKTLEFVVKAKKAGTVSFAVSDKTDKAFSKNIEVTIPESAIPVPLKTSKFSKYFTKNSQDEWVFEHQFSGSDAIGSMSVVLNPQDDGSYQTSIYGFYFSRGDRSFSKTSGYDITIDDSTYSFRDCQISVSFDTNQGTAECAYACHPLLDTMLQHMAEAKNTIKICNYFDYSGFDIGYSTKYSSGDSGFKSLKKMAKSLVDAHYFSNVSSEYSIFADQVTASEQASDD